MEAAGKRLIQHPTRSDSIRLWHLSDLHYLSKGCAVGEIRKDIRTIADDPFSFWLGGGDYVDFIGYRDKRFDPDCVAEWVPVKALADLGRYGVEKLLELLDPIKHKCLGLLLGNHELKYELQTEQVANLGYCALMDVVFRRRSRLKPSIVQKWDSISGNSQSFRLFCHHGAGYAQTPGGKLNRLVQFMQSFDADIYFVGHVHDKTARKEPAISANEECTKITQRERLGVIAGSYLRTYTQGHIGYGEQKGYRPTALGAAVVRIHPMTRQMEAAV